MSTERRFSDEEVARILDQATRVERTEPTPRMLAADQDGITLGELQDIGKEVGIAPHLIADAALALDRPAAVRTRSFMGTPIAVGRTVELPRRLTDPEWDRLVVDLRETFDARGRLHRDGSFRQWTNGNLQALLEPTERGERLRLRTLKSDATTTLGLGAGLLLLAPVLFAILALTGGLADPATLRVPMVLSVVGAAMFGASKLKLPRWADTRQLQMDGVASRLTEALESPERTLPRLDPAPRSGRGSPLLDGDGVS